MDSEMLTHLEGCGSINWNSAPTWQYHPVKGGGGAGRGAGQECWSSVGPLAQHLEVLVYCGHVTIM